MVFIRIKEPPMNYGFVKIPFRKALVGLTFPIATDEKLAKRPIGIGPDNTGVYLIPRSEAIVALRKANRRTAADFWESLKFDYIRVDEEIREVVKE